MKRAFIFAIFLILAAGAVAAQNSISNFVFITEPQSISPGVSSDTITIQAQSADGEAVAAGSLTCLRFDSSSLTGEFSANRDNWKAIIATHMSSTWSQRNFYYRDAISGEYTLTVKAAYRPDDAPTCPNWPLEEWDARWTASQQIIVSSATVGSDPTSAGSAPTKPPSSPPPSSLLSSFEYPSIRAYAGEDRQAVAGAWVEFRAKALGLNGEPLENARFWWNFGDGETREGKAVSRIFRIPGAYTVGLHVSSGGYAASDYLTVAVVPNQLQVKEVISREDGYVKFINNGQAEVDFGGWILEDSWGKKFTVPVKTKIGPQAEIALLNSVTGLFLNGSDSLMVRYPNSREALHWSKYSARSEISPPNTPAASVAVEFRSEVSPPTPTSVGPQEGPAESSQNSKVINQELAQTSAAGPGKNLFLILAVLISAAAGAGFVLVRHYGKT